MAKNEATSPVQSVGLGCEFASLFLLAGKKGVVYPSVTGCRWRCDRERTAYKSHWLTYLYVMSTLGDILYI